MSINGPLNPNYGSNFGQNPQYAPNRPMARPQPRAPAPAVEVRFRLPEASEEIQLMALLDDAIKHFAVGFPSTPISHDEINRAVTWLYNKYNTEK